MELVKTKIKQVNNTLSRHLLSKVLRNSITGDIDDLLHLRKYIQLVEHVPGLPDYLRRLVSDAEKRTGSALLFERIGKQLSEAAKHRLIENFLYTWAARGSEKNREFYEQEGICVPRFIVLSPTMRCNLHCSGCYSGLYQKAEELSEAEIENIILQSREIGAYFMVISGGEPFMIQDVLLRLFEKYSDMFFMVYTNGTLIDRKTIDKLAELGNAAPAISLEGYEYDTDRRRGKGVYNKAVKTIKALSDAGVITGASITYTRENVDTVTAPEFVDHLISLGAVFSWYFMFMPVGTDPVLELVPTPRQRLTCGKRIEELRREKPIFLADFWNDGPAAGGCLAGGRTYMHILNDGSIEPCVFAHFKVDNIRNTSLKDASNSEFFRSIRKSFPYNETGNLKRPCMIIDNPEVLRRCVDAHVVKAGHEHSEDLVKDEQVMAWIDSYSREYASLVDPLWQEELDNPKSKWYRNKEAYKDIFSSSYRKV